MDCIDKHFLMEKMAFLLMPNICFHEAEISWINIFSGNTQRDLIFFDFKNILATSKKDVVLNISTF